jgi:glycosyltransferase involved in cell wall biosynthesis
MKTVRILFVHRLGGLGDRIRTESILTFLRESGFSVRQAILPSTSFEYLKKEGTAELLINSFPLHKIRPYDIRTRRLVSNFLSLNTTKNFLDRIGCKLDFDLILAETSLVGWQTLELFRRSSKPLVVDVHGLVGSEARGKGDKSWHIKEILETEVFKDCNHLLAVSEKMKEHITRTYKIPNNKVTVIYNGAYSQAHKAEFNHPLKVIYAGLFAYWERVDDYLEIAKKANSNDFKFYLAGFGPMKKHILTRMKRERIPIKYLGYLPRSIMLSVMSKMQIGIVPSTKDLTRLVAFPIKVLDYMSCGLPVVAPSVGDWGKLLETEGCGIALENDSISEYIAALGTIKSKDVWQEKSNNGIQAVKAKYNWNTVLLPLRDLMMQLSCATS